METLIKKLSDNSFRTNLPTYVNYGPLQEKVVDLAISKLKETYGCTKPIIVDNMPSEQELSISSLAIVSAVNDIMVSTCTYYNLQ